MLTQSINLRHARLQKLARDANVSVTDLARAAASMDGQLAAFDADTGNLGVGVFAHYNNFIEELLERATTCAKQRQRD